MKNKVMPTFGAMRGKSYNKKIFWLLDLLVFLLVMAIPQLFVSAGDTLFGLVTEMVPSGGISDRAKYLFFPLVVLVTFLLVSVLRTALAITLFGLHFPDASTCCNSTQLIGRAAKRTVVPLLVISVFVFQAAEVLSPQNAIPDGWSVTENKFPLFIDVFSLWVLNLLVIDLIEAISMMFFALRRK